MNGAKAAGEARRPKVSIGVPVYNGAKYLADTLDSILTQSFADLEVIISDNASDDETSQICLAGAARDQRIRYIRNTSNLGAARNYNQVFELSRGEYFKWNGHDDPLAPTFVERCVEALDADPEVVLCFSRVRIINERGEDRGVNVFYASHFAPKPQLGNPRAHTRFRHAVLSHPNGAIFGLIRRSVLAGTPLIGAYRSSDLPLLGELALRGRFHQIPDFLQYSRLHAEQGRAVYQNRRLREAWFDPRRSQMRTYPYLRLLREHLRSIRRAARDRRTRVYCYGHMVMWVFKYMCFRLPLRMMVRRPYRLMKATRGGKAMTRLFARKVGG